MLAIVELGLGFSVDGKFFFTQLSIERHSSNI